MVSALFLLSLLHVAVACSHDNCLRALIRAPGASQFCATYTTALNTATTGLPPFATQCTHTNIPSQVSSACSCLASPTPPLQCTAAPVVKDLDFQTLGAPGSPWSVNIEIAAGGTEVPEYGLIGPSFIVRILDFQPDPYESTVTLSQPGIQLCNGNYILSYQYLTWINGIAADSANEVSNCFIKSGLDGVVSSVLDNTSLPWETENLQEPWVTVHYAFTIAGLPNNGFMSNLFFTFGCLRDDWSPEIQFMSPTLTRL